MKIKKNRCLASVLIAMLAAMLLLPATALAGTVNDDSIATEKGEIKAGITPDSMFHFFDRSLDRLSLAFTADPEKKTEKALEIARERLMEAKKMAEKGDDKAASRAQSGHDQMLTRIEDAARKASDDSSRTRLEREIELENELEVHRSEIETVESLVKSRISLSNPGSVEAANLLSKFKVETENTRAEIEREMENTIIQLKLETGQSDDDVSAIVRTIEDRIGVDDSRRRGRGSDDAREIELGDDSSRQSGGSNRIQARVFDDFTRIRVEIDFSTSSQERNAILGEMLSRARLSRQEIDQLLDLRVAEDVEAPRERLRTDAKLRDEGTEAEFELEFPVNTKDREAIVNAIFNRLNGINVGDLGVAMNVDDRRGLNDDENELLDRRRGADKPEDDNIGGEFATATDRRRGADKPEDNGLDDGLNDVSGRTAEGEAPRGADSPSDFDSTPGSRGGSGSGGSSDD